MLVSELENLSLFKITSGDRVDYPLVHDSLYKCAQEILAKYKQKQKLNERIVIKAQAIQILLRELGDAPKDPRAAILTALKHYAEALQGYEHLLSTKGNTYELIKQTQGLRESDDEPVSLLRYHGLKSKVLKLDVTLVLKDKKAMREAIAELSAKKGLTLKILETIERIPGISAAVLGKLHKAGLLEPDWCTIIFEHKSPADAAEALIKLHQGGLLTRSDVRERVFEHKSPVDAAEALVKLHQGDLLTRSDVRKRVLEHKNPVDAAEALAQLHQGNLLKPDLCNKVLKHRNLYRVVEALWELNKTGLLEPNLCARMMIYDNPESSARSLSSLNKQATVILRDVFSETEKIKLMYDKLATQMDDDARGFFRTLQNGHTETRAFVVENRIVSGSLICHMTSQKVHNCLITNFINRCAMLIASLPLSKTQKAEVLYRLLTNNSADGVPGFHIALQNGHADAITVFIRESTTAIAELNLPEAQRAELLYRLLASKKVDGTPGLYMALYNGHTEAIRTFIQASAAVIVKLSLPKPEKADLLCELLASKAATGKPGFYMALQNGNSDALSVFIQTSALAMTTFFESKEEGAELLYELFLGMESANTPGFLLALELGGPKVNEAFIQGIDRLPLSDEKKEALKYPVPGQEHLKFS